VTEESSFAGPSTVVLRKTGETSIYISISAASGAAEKAVVAESIDINGRRASDGDLLRPWNTYGTFTYDDCVRDNRPAGRRLKREITVTTGQALLPVERLFAKSWATDATTPRYSRVAMTRSERAVAATRAIARLKDQVRLLFTWIENDAQVTVLATDFFDEIVLDVISKLIVSTPGDYQ
jgi:hypothetical protein